METSQPKTSSDNFTLPSLQNKSVPLYSSTTIAASKTLLLPSLQSDEVAFLINAPVTCFTKEVEYMEGHLKSPI